MPHSIVDPFGFGCSPLCGCTTGQLGLLLAWLDQSTVVLGLVGQMGVLVRLAVKSAPLYQRGHYPVYVPPKQGPGRVQTGDRPIFWHIVHKVAAQRTQTCICMHDSSRLLPLHKSNDPNQPLRI